MYRNTRSIVHRHRHENLNASLRGTHLCYVKCRCVEYFSNSLHYRVSRLSSIYSGPKSVRAKLSRPSVPLKQFHETVCYLNLPFTAPLYITVLPSLFLHVFKLTRSLWCAAWVAQIIYWLLYILDARRIQVRFPANAIDFFLFTASRPALRFTDPPIHWEPGAISSTVEWLECATGLSSNSIEVKNAWSYTFTPLYCGAYSNTVITYKLQESSYKKSNINSMTLVRKRAISTERPARVGEVTANLCG
jgi:hypothetical protein